MVEEVKTSTGNTEGLIAADLELKILLEDYDKNMEQYTTLMDMVEKLMPQISGVAEFLKNKGIGLVTATGFIVEVGDISRFSHLKQIQKFVDLNLRGNSSGKHKIKSGINKRGRKRLKTILFRAMMPLVAKNKKFTDIHGYYTTSQNNPLKKIRTLILLCCKLIRVMYAILEKAVRYEPEKLLSDMRKVKLLVA